MKGVVDLKKILVGAGRNGLRMFEHFGDENVHCFADISRPVVLETKR